MFISDKFVSLSAHNWFCCFLSIQSSVTIYIYTHTIVLLAKSPSKEIMCPILFLGDEEKTNFRICEPYNVVVNKCLRSNGK